MLYPRTDRPELRRIWIKPEAENAKAVYAALIKFGAPLEGLTFADFAELGPFFHMGHEPLAVDILSEIPGVDFDAAWERRVEGVIEAVTGLKSTLISHEDLITAKLAAGRPQDLADVDAIRRVEQAQRPWGKRET
jgi:hypothetical protein